MLSGPIISAGTDLTILVLAKTEHTDLPERLAYTVLLGYKATLHTRYGSKRGLRRLIPQLDCKTTIPIARLVMVLNCPHTVQIGDLGGERRSICSCSFIFDRAHPYIS